MARRDRHWAGRAAAIGLVLALIAGSAGALIAGASGGGDEPEPTSTTAPPELTEAGEELAALLARGREQTFHARYEAVSPDVQGDAVHLETWQSPPRTRQDTALVVQGQQVETRALVTPEGNLRCNRVGGGDWECRRVPAEQAGADALTERIRQQLNGAEVTSEDRTIDGRAARCFLLTRDGERSQLCLTDTGIPLRVEAGQSVVRLVALDAEVDPELFEPPASPTS